MTKNYSHVNIGAAEQTPSRIIHFTPASSFDGKFLFHPALHNAKEEVHFFAVGRSGFRVDQATLSHIAREYLRAGRLLLTGLGKRNRRSVAYCHTTLYALPALILCRLLGVGRVIYFNHGVPYIGQRGWKRLVLKTIDRLNVLAAHRFITISPAMVPYLRPGAQPWAHSTFPGSSSGLSSLDFVSKSEVHTKPDLLSKPVRYLYAGRLQKRKGMFVLLEAWRLHVKAFPEDELWLCGFSQDEFETLGSSAALPNVTVHGYVNDMAQIYSQVDVVVSPSFHEGFGYTLLEGAARGCCVVSSDVPGPDVMFTPWMQGQLFAAGAHHSLSDVMARLSRSPMELAIAKRLSYRSALRFEMGKISYPHLSVERPA